MRLQILVLALSLSLGSAPLYATQYVVAEAKGTHKLRSGDLVDAVDRVRIEKQGSLVLLTADGIKFQIDGAYDGRLESRIQNQAPDLLAERGDKDSLKEMGRILRLHRVKRRSNGSTPKDPWHISLRDNGDQCIQGEDRPTLWRPDATNNSQIELVLKAPQDQTHIRFAKGSQTQLWPIDLAIRDKGTYSIQDLSQRGAYRFNLHRLPTSISNRAAQAVQLNRFKCKRQAASLLLQADIDRLLGKLISQDQF